MDNGFIIRGTVSMLVRWFCDLNYVGTLVYAEMVGRHYGDLDLHGGRADVLGPNFLGYVAWRGSVVERRSLAGELSLSCARPAADG